MHSRTDILVVFSTFIQFSGDKFDRWISDPRLAKSMQQQLLQNGTGTEHSETFWILYWYRLRSQYPRANAHLCAYLQEPCYLAADKVTRRFAMVQCSLADGFQIAIAHVDRILKGYNPDYGSSLKAYARKAFGNCIRDQLRQQQEVNISSDWGLLRRLSQTQLNQALLAAGYIQTSMPILIWQCFKAVCIPDPKRSARGLSAPSPEQLDAIVLRYNQLRHQLAVDFDTELVNTDIASQQLMMELMRLATLVRAYLTPVISSLNQSQYEDSGEEQLDALSTDDTPMVQLLAAEAFLEQQQRLQEMGTVLEDAIAALDCPNQTLLHMYYYQTLTQKEIASQLNIQQYQVSRKLSRIRQGLLLSVIKWAQETLHISSNSDVLASVSEVIHEWLQQHYASKPPKESE